MNWFTIGAAVIVVLFALNSAFVLTRRARRAASGDAARVPIVKRTLSPWELGGMLAMVAVWLACFAAPIVAPRSDLGKAMANPWTLASILPWSVLVAVVFSISVMLLRRRRAGKAA